MTPNKITESNCIVDPKNPFIFTKIFNNYIKEEGQYEDVLVRKIILDKDGNELEFNVGELPEGEKRFQFILRNDGQEYGPVFTNEYGEAYFKNVLPGKYEVTEVLSTQQAIMFEPQEDVFVIVKECTLTPTSFRTMEQQIPDSQRVCNWVTFSNKLRNEKFKTVRVIKSVIDRRNDSPSLSGFEFKLYRIVEGEEVEEIVKTTTSSGVIEFKGLIEGKYKLYETNRNDFIEGVGIKGKELTLDEETTPNDILQLEVINTRIYDNQADDDDEDEENQDSDDDEDDEDEPEEGVKTDVFFTPSVIPLSTPVVIVDPQPVVDAVEEIEVAEETPQATLPKTGTADPMLFSGLGGALLGLGLLLKKKKEDK